MWRWRRSSAQIGSEAVLSIGKLVAGAEGYYLRTVAPGPEDYYTGADEAPGTWLGPGCRALGLAGEVKEDDLRSVLRGLSPSDSSPLGHGPPRPTGDWTE